MGIKTNVFGSHLVVRVHLHMSSTCLYRVTVESFCGNLQTQISGVWPLTEAVSEMLFLKRKLDHAKINVA